MAPESNTLDDFEASMTQFSLYYVYIGIAVFISSIFQVTIKNYSLKIQFYLIMKRYLAFISRILLLFIPLPEL